jgi:hypothetical protein
MCRKLYRPFTQYTQFSSAEHRLTSVCSRRYSPLVRTSDSHEIGRHHRECSGPVHNCRDSHHPGRDCQENRLPQILKLSTFPRRPVLHGHHHRGQIITEDAFFPAYQGWISQAPLCVHHISDCRPVNASCEKRDAVLDNHRMLAKSASDAVGEPQGMPTRLLESSEVFREKNILRRGQVSATLLHSLATVVTTTIPRGISPKRFSQTMVHRTMQHC